MHQVSRLFGDGMIKKSFVFNSVLFLAVGYLLLTFSGCDDFHRMTPTHPLLHAASWNDLAGIDIALAQGHYVDTTDPVGNTALHIAASYGKVDAAKRLIERGANVNARDRTGRTPLHIASPQNEGHIFYRRYIATMHALIDAGANVNAQDSYGDTPLHRAAYWGCPENVTALRSRWADVNIRNFMNQTAADQTFERIAEKQLRAREMRLEGNFESARSFESEISRLYRVLDALRN
jgi:ankyrin repeat protein